MSTRLYPLYQKGNPQLRVFLSNFWMKLVRPEHKQPPNVVQFHCSMEMTRYDIKNYLEKIYNVKSTQVNTRIVLGKTREEPGKGYVIKDDDYKVAYVVLPKDEKFEFPNLFPESAEKEKLDHDKALDEVRKNHQKYLEKNSDRPGLPGWFSF
ncbi:hypothetical protein PPYR_07971 [Photinus pyralis]|uniref:Large ribosomal subunit protein uL23m n=1 Tax=Photinus pyralis TaxID=7054 RepID=A0A1Y1K9A7_PHOPY|nr:probable 39S ribosomal protein L23, mitochondrial [Photinus pyralis]KAB0800091.1 hypothetical protein PPYR_07971 [Photinus pyralis]